MLNYKQIIFNVILATIFLSILLLDHFLYANSFQQKQKNAKLVIVLIDETDSFGKNPTKGSAKVLYWEEALTLTKSIVEALNPKDEFLMIAIDDKGFEEEDILIPLQQIDRSFLKSKMQKRKLEGEIISLKRRKEKYQKTDVLSALYQAAYYAKQEKIPETVIVCFSDMIQEPQMPSLADTKNLSFPDNSRSYFFFVDASGRERWDQLLNIWVLILQQAGLNIGDDDSPNFFQYGQSSLHVERMLKEW